MLRLLLLRHAEAIPFAAGGDIDRALSAIGRADARRMGAYFRKSALAPDLVLVSPAIRACETLEMVEAELPQKPPRAVEASLHAADAAALEALLAHMRLGVQTLLIVGHNPGLAEFANILAGDGESADLARMRAHFPAPCLAVIDFEQDLWSEARAGRGRLDRFVTLATLSGKDG